ISPLLLQRPSYEIADLFSYAATPGLGDAALLDPAALSITLFGLGRPKVAFFHPHTAARTAYASLELLGNGEPQPGLRQVCLACFAEATLQHEKLKPSIGKELDCGSGSPLLDPDILAGIFEKRHQPHAIAFLHFEQCRLVSVNPHMRPVSR